MSTGWRLLTGAYKVTRPAAQLAEHLAAAAERMAA